ncbi:DUF2345 domain-containing protein [Velocimicrobium porci]|uniref:DUF2345 domain-containing protein n=1 Tax=Velocimicrobium porci TaxID=2606634 RepID=A0A6L5Y1X5_9FIRM|nr:DUF2345 domain-containing protein [Velocimicrobium porci]MSS65035.1 DUF2345 domain-containing protein [Velocimicrobium porci]
MNVIEVGCLSIKPFELERLLEVKLKQQRNEHAVLTFFGIVKEGVKETELEKIDKGTNIEFCHKKNIIFSGILQSVKITCKNQVYYLKGTAVSYTILLDLALKRRSFQEHGMAYSNVADICIKEKQGKMEYCAEEKKIENLLLQYDETDWEFLKRIASHSHSVLIPKIDKESASFYFGIPEGVEYQERLKVEDYSIQKDLALERELSQCKELSFEKKDSYLYTFDTDRYSFSVGDMLELNGKKLYVAKATLHLKGSVLNCHYQLRTKKAFSVPMQFHKGMIGLSLDGTVLEVINDTVKVQLKVDEKQETATAYAFPYATNYSAEQNTGWYVMPEVGDQVKILFPSEDENMAYAVQSVRKQKTDKTKDAKVKYFRTADGKEIKFDRQEILITAKDGSTFVKINETSGVEIQTNREIKLTSGGNIAINGGNNIAMIGKNNVSIHAGGNFSISAGSGLQMTCRDNSMKMETPSAGIMMSAKKPIEMAGKSQVSIKSDGAMSASSKDAVQISAAKKIGITSSETMNLVCKTNQVTLESGGKGIAAVSSKPIEIKGSDTVTVDGKKDVMIHASKNITSNADQKQTLSAGTSMESSCRGSSILLDGTIDLKASLIKEN